IGIIWGAHLTRPTLRRRFRTSSALIGNAFIELYFCLELGEPRRLGESKRAVRLFEICDDAWEGAIVVFSLIPLDSPYRQSYWLMTTRLLRLVSRRKPEPASCFCKTTPLNGSSFPVTGSIALPVKVPLASEIAIASRLLLRFVTLFPALKVR